MLAEATPSKLIKAVLRRDSVEEREDVNMTDAFGFCLDYERRDVVKALFRRLPMDMCGTCGTKEGKLRVCAACGVVRYCSPACQKKDWKEGHRDACAQLKEENERGLRTIPVGFLDILWAW